MLKLLLLSLMLVSITICSVDSSNSSWPAFYIYTRANIDVPIIVQNNASSACNTSLITYLIIHGYTDSANKSWVLDIKDNLLKMQDANVIAVDWSEGAVSFNGTLGN